MEENEFEARECPGLALKTIFGWCYHLEPFITKIQVCVFVAIDRCASQTGPDYGCDKSAEGSFNTVVRLR